MDQKDLIINRIKLLKQVQPRKEWKDSNRAFLLAKIKGEFCKDALQCVSTQKIRKKVISPLIRDIRLPLHNFRTEKISDSQVETHCNASLQLRNRLRGILFSRAFARPICALILFFSIACGALAMGIKSQESITGDRLYPVKIAIENTKVFLTSQDKKAELHAELAECRLNEVSKVAKANDLASVKKEKIEKTIEVFKKEVKTAKVHLAEPITDNNSEKTAAIAKNIEAKTDKFEKVLGDIPENLPEEIKGDIKVSIDEALDVSEETGDKALEVMADNMDGISEEEMLTKITQEIQKTEDKIAKAEVKVEEVKKKRKEGIIKDDKDGEEDKVNEEIKKTGSGEECLLAGEVFGIKEIFTGLIIKAVEAEEVKKEEKVNELNPLNPEDSGTKEDTNKIEGSSTLSDDEILNKVLKNLQEAKALLEKAKEYLEEKDFKTALKFVSTAKELIKKAEAAIETLPSNEISSDKSESEDIGSGEEVRDEVETEGTVEDTNTVKDSLNKEDEEKPEYIKEELEDSEDNPENSESDELLKIDEGVK